MYLQRTNNTPGAVTNTTTTYYIPVVTTSTQTLVIENLPEIVYTTSNTNDIITIYASVDALPSAGSATIYEASIIAERAY